jgi:hypothetical protein
MAEYKRRGRRRSSENIGTVVPISLQKIRRENLSRLGCVAYALWPDDPVAGLARRVKCTKRHASFLIEGKRKPNARAALAVYAEIIG